MSKNDNKHISNKNNESTFSKCFHGTIGVGCGCVFLVIGLPTLLFGVCSLLSELFDGSNKKVSTPTYEQIQQANEDGINPELRGYSIGIESQIVNQFQYIPRFYETEVLSKLNERYPDLNLTIRYKKDKPYIGEIIPLNKSNNSKKYGWIWEFTTNESVDEYDREKNRSTNFVVIYDQKGVPVVVETQSNIFLKIPDKKVLDALRKADFISR